MAKNIALQVATRKKPEQIVDLLSKKHGVSNRYVQMVISGDRQNNEIFEDYMAYSQEHNKLLKAVLAAVPFTTQFTAK